MSDLPPETISAALLAYVIHRQAKCESRVEDIADAMNLPKPKRKRGRAVLLVIGAVLLSLFTGHSQRAREVVGKVWATFAQR